MALVVTQQVFLDLLTLCLTWEWEKAEEKFQATLGLEQTVWPTQSGYTTVDKVVRILNGLRILTNKQRKVLYKDRRLQSLVLRHTATCVPGDFIDSLRRQTARDLLLRCDAVEEINRERMLRNMHFFITEAGRAKAAVLAPRYQAAITKERYKAEIKRQNDLIPTGAAKVAINTQYRARVEEETKG